MDRRGRSRRGDSDPTIWALEQDYSAPDGSRLTRRGFLARVRLAPYGEGIRPHERTQPGPKEDRLRLTRATRHNLSPIFALHPGNAWRHLEPALVGDPWGEVTDGDGTTHRVWRIGDPAVHEAITDELAPGELLIADGHHRYETSLAYQREVGAGGPADYVLMALVSLEDPGLTVFPTHRLISGLADDPAKQEALGTGLRELFEVEEVPDGPSSTLPGSKGSASSATSTRISSAPTGCGWPPTRRSIRRSRSAPRPTGRSTPPSSRSSS